ncbi:MAG: translocation/assembly module TamB [Treponema sp.]|nr:translocation/assembly module TamB [Treponema sp.]
MSFFSEKNGKKSLSRAVYVQIIVFFGLIGISAIALQPVQSALQRGISRIRSDFIEKIEMAIGREIVYSSIRPTIFGSFSIRNLKISGSSGSTEALLTLSNLNISYSLWDLIKGNKAAVYRIHIDHPVIHLDIEKDRDIFELLSSFQKKGQDIDTDIIRKITEFFPDEPDYKIKDCFFTLTDGGKTYQVEDFNMDIRGKNDMISLDGKLTACLVYSGIINRTYSLKTPVNIHGSYSYTQSMAEIVLSSLSVFEHEGLSSKTLVSLQPLTIAIAIKDSIVSLETGGGRELYALYFDYNLDSALITGKIKSDNFPLSTLLKLRDEHRDNSLSMTVTGSASFERENSGSFCYNIDFHGGDLEDSFLIRANGSEKNVVVEELSLAFFTPDANSFFQGGFNFSGSIGFAPFSAQGAVVFDSFSLSGDEYINAALLITSPGEDIRITGETVAIGQVAFNAFDISIFPSGGDLGIIASCARENSFVSVDATFNYRPSQLEASFVLDSFSLYDLAGVFRPFVKNINIPQPGTSYLQNTSIAAEIFFTTDFNQFMYHAPNLVISYETGGTDNVMGIISLSGTNQYFSLSEGVFFNEGNEFRISSFVNFSSLVDFGFSMDANYRELSWHIEGHVLDRTTLTIRSTCGLHAYGSISGTGAVSGYVEGLNFPLPVNGRQALLNFYTSLRYDSKDFWSFDVDHFEIRVSNPAKGLGLLRISGIADQDGASFNELVYSDDISALQGRANFSWSRDFTSLRMAVNMNEGQRRLRPQGLLVPVEIFEGANFNDSVIFSENSGLPEFTDGREYYFLNGLYEDGYLDLKAAVSGMRLDRFIREAGMTLISGEAAVSWNSISSFDARVFLRSLNSVFQGNVFQASASARMTGDDFSIYDLRLYYDDLYAFSPLLQLNRAGITRAGMNVQGFVFDKKLEGKIELDAHFAPIDSWIEINRALNAIAGSVKAANVQYGDIESKEPFIFVFERSNGDFSVSGGPKNMLRLEIDRNGNFFAGLTSPFPVQGTVVGRLKDSYIDAHCANLYVDLPVFFDLLPPSPGIKITGGYIVSSLDIRGPLRDPEFFGAARGSSIKLRVPRFIGGEIKPSPFNIAIEGNEMSFSRVETAVGNGRGAISGWFRFERWIPNRLGFEISVPRSSPIPYYIDIPNFHAKGDASGKLFLNVDDYALDIRGDLFANNTEMGLSTEETSPSGAREAASDSALPVIINITVTTGSTVEFIWPNTNFPILRANPEMGTVLNISADTFSRQFSLVSDVKIRSGELYYFERSFYIRRGTLVLRENEREFNPRFSVRAEIRDRTDTGPVTISMVIDNEPLLSFVPRFEANPVLTQLEIYSLLGQNLASQSGDSADTAQRFFLASTTDLLAQFVVVRQVERYIRNIMRLDMFSVRTQVLQNAFLSATGLGQGPVDRNSSVGNYFDNTTIFGGKYIGQDMFVQGMLSMRYDENELAGGSLRLEPDIGVELQSPFFNIRWVFFPYHPENWWVNDNSITLLWSKSF